MRLPENVSESVKKRNPALFGLAPVCDPKRESNQRGGGQDNQLETRTPSLGYRITIISVRSRLVDAHDNLRTGAKPLIDQITETLGFKSDDDPRLQWSYQQFVGKPIGTIVILDAYETHIS